MRLSNPASSRLHSSDAIVLDDAEMHGQMGWMLGVVVVGQCQLLLVYVVLGEVADIGVELDKTRVSTEI